MVLTFKPTLSDLEVQEEAVRVLCQAEETRKYLEKLETESIIKSELDILVRILKQLILLPLDTDLLNVNISGSRW